MSRAHKKGSQFDSGFADSVEKLGDDVNRIRDDLTDTARDVASAAAEGVAIAQRGMRQTVRSAREQGAQAAESMATQITERPWTSIAMAAGAGVLLGMFLCRRMDA